jgi:hypothetical protein
MCLSAAYYSPFLGYLCAIGAILVFAFFIHRNEQTAEAAFILLTPLFLRMDIAYALPLSAAFFQYPIRGAQLALAASIAGLSYMLAGNIHRFGPLWINHAGVPVVMKTFYFDNTSDFFDLHWLNSLVSPGLRGASEDFFNSIYPSLLHPPAVFIQMAGWALAAYVGGLFFQKRSLKWFTLGLGLAGAIFLAQASFIKNAGGASASSTEILTCFLNPRRLSPSSPFSGPKPRRKPIRIWIAQVGILLAASRMSRKKYTW